MPRDAPLAAEASASRRRACRAWRWRGDDVSDGRTVRGVQRTQPAACRWPARGACDGAVSTVPLAPPFLPVHRATGRVSGHCCVAQHTGPPPPHVLVAAAGQKSRDRAQGGGRQRCNLCHLPRRERNKSAPPHCACSDACPRPSHGWTRCRSTRRSTGCEGVPCSRAVQGSTTQLWTFVLNCPTPCGPFALPTGAAHKHTDTSCSWGCGTGHAPAQRDGRAAFRFVRPDVKVDRRVAGVCGMYGQRPAWSAPSSWPGSCTTHSPGLSASARGRGLACVTTAGDVDAPSQSGGWLLTAHQLRTLLVSRGPGTQARNPRRGSPPPPPTAAVPPTCDAGPPAPWAAAPHARSPVPLFQQTPGPSAEAQGHSRLR